MSPRKRNDQRGEKSTALINRTKTSFVNHFGSGQCDCERVAKLHRASNAFANISFFAYESSTCRYSRWNYDVGDQSPTWLCRSAKLASLKFQANQPSSSPCRAVSPTAPVFIFFQVWRG